MAKVTIANLDQKASVPARLEWLSSEPPAAASTVIETGGLSLRLHQVTCPGGTRLSWSPNASDLCIYVLAGGVELDDRKIEAGGCAVVEHGGTATMVAAADTRLAVFENLEPAGKSGGAVHFIAAEQVPDNRGKVPDTDLAASALMADASCASCDLWLHANWFPEGMSVGLHSHSEDEIILVTRGEIILGNRKLPAPAAVSVAKNAIYGFTAGAGGMDMVNFRAGSPVAIQAKSKHVTDEAAFFLSRCGHPEHVYVQ
jgi:hypothetical protein